MDVRCAYNWRMLKDSLKVFRNSEIKEIFVPKKGQAGRGFVFGILLAGGAGLVLGTNLPFATHKDIGSTTVLFGAIGGIVGLIVGKSTDKKVTYKSNDPRISLLLMSKPEFSNIPPPEIEEYIAKYKKDVVY